MKVPKSTITIIRQNIHNPSERKFQNIMMDINHNIPDGYKFMPVRGDKDKFVLQGKSSYIHEVMDKLKQAKLDFITETQGKDFNPIKIITDSDTVQEVAQSMRVDKISEQFSKQLAKVFG